MLGGWIRSKLNQGNPVDWLGWWVGKVQEVFWFHFVGLPISTSLLLWSPPGPLWQEKQSFGTRDEAHESEKAGCPGPQEAYETLSPRISDDISAPRQIPWRQKAKTARQSLLQVGWGLKKTLTNPTNSRLKATDPLTRVEHRVFWKVTCLSCCKVYYPQSGCKP